MEEGHFLLGDDFCGDAGHVLVQRELEESVI